ncbi:hypothetical protein ACXWO0_10510, partial [Streptococcus pyogenes]
ACFLRNDAVLRGAALARDVDVLQGQAAALEGRLALRSADADMAEQNAARASAQQQVCVWLSV